MTKLGEGSEVLVTTLGKVNELIVIPGTVSGGGGGSGDVTGPGSSTSGNVASFNGTTGKIIQDSGLAVSAVTTLTGAQTLTNKTLTAPAISSPTGLVKGDVGLGNVANVNQQDAANLTSGTVDPARLGSGASITTKFLRGDSTWQTIAGGGDALTTNPLSQFATTTSAQLAGVLSDETGTGAAVFATSPALVTPTGIVKSDVGLGNVDNTSDATKNAAAVTLTNKTLTAPVISTISNTGTVTLPTATTTLVGRDTTDTLTNKSIDAAQLTGTIDNARLDGDLSTIAGLTATTDNFLQAKSSAWASRTPAQVKTDLSLPTDTVADLAAKAPLASPTFTGTPVIPNAIIDEEVVAASGTSGTVTCDLSTSLIFTLSPTGNVTTLTLSNVPATGRAVTVTLLVTQGGTPRTIATPTGGIFMGAASPTQVASKACAFTYVTVDGGTVWYCSAAVQV